MPLKSGQTRKGLRNLSTGVSAIPDSVVYQYRAGDFASPWPDNVGSADMTVNGLSSATFNTGGDAVAGDGSSDHGLASGPEDLPTNETFGIAFTFAAANVSGDSYFGSVNSVTSARLFVDTGNSGDGRIRPRLQDDDATNNELRVQTDNTYDDGTVRAAIINKNGNSVSDLEIFVDNMADPEPTTTQASGPFDHTDYSQSEDFAFYANNNDGTVEEHIDMDSGVFEFSTDPYNQSERESFVSRRPEVS